MNDYEVPTVDQVTEETVRSQLERILLSPSFRSSKRLSRFLRFVIDKTLSGTAQDIKERIIGVEVFDREVHYDVSSDPIVRVAAGDIRKRLAQYYIQPGHEHELRIELPPGSYIATFYMPRGSDAAATVGISRLDPRFQISPAPSDVLPNPESTIPVFDPATLTVNSSKRNHVLIVVALALLVLVVVAASGLLWSPVDTHVPKL